MRRPFESGPIAPIVTLAVVATALASLLAVLPGEATAAAERGSARAELPGSQPSPQSRDDVDPALLERARALLRESPLIDGHNDLAYTIINEAAGDVSSVDLYQVQGQLSADIPRLREGQVGGQFWSAYADSATMWTDTELDVSLDAIDVVHRFVDQYPELEFASTADDVERIFSEGRVASMIGVEGGHMINNQLGALRLFHSLGARYMTLTHFRSTDWADSATDKSLHGGLTEFGEEVVREMNRLGIFVDLSHVSDATMRDALRVTEAPVMYSHSSARAVNPHLRNVPDDILEMVADNGGVVMVNFYGGYVAPTTPEWNRLLQTRDPVEATLIAIMGGDEPVWALRKFDMLEQLRARYDDQAQIDRAFELWSEANPAPRGTLENLADHIDHIRTVAGVESIGIGADYFDSGTPSMAEGAEDITSYPYLFAELLRRGYTDDEVKMIAGGNILRAMRQMESVANRLRGERPASSARIQ